MIPPSITSTIVAVVAVAVALAVVVAVVLMIVPSVVAKKKLTSAYSNSHATRAPRAISGSTRAASDESLDGQPTG
jgi:uncharacterized low-complexity protein